MAPPTSRQAARHVKLLLFLLLPGCAGRGPAQGPAPGPRYAVVPAPASLQPRSGSLRLDASIPVRAESEEALAVADLLVEGVRRIAGVALPVAASGSGAEGAGEGGGILLRIDGTAADSLDESYTLDVTATGAVLAARSPAGLFRGSQTLLQLVSPGTDPGTDPRPGAGSAAAATVPAVRIEDAPRFPYRGMHLDVGRHFFPPDFIRKYVDLLALYRFNTFHWHLTEDQGWRLEIDAYPRLTEVGAWRRETVVGRTGGGGDGLPHGGFYTKEEVREIVAYAAARHITVIPEIEMPGHSLAALAAYPELACTEGPFEVGTRWGVYEDILCPHEATFAFLETVLAEVMELFPSRYLHIGGDEAPKLRWRESAAAQAVMRREGLADETELQSWFIRRIDRFLNGHGRRLIGWDEILEGGLAPGATIMSWRGVAGGIAAARQGRDVIMTPTSHAYFDYLQGPADEEPPAFGGFLPLEQVYAFEPVPPELTAAEAGHVLGAQGNVWTEYIQTPEHVEYMVLPRLLAMAEVVWSPVDRRNWSGFLERLPAQLERLDRLGYDYRVPDVAGLEDALVLEDSYPLHLSVPVRGAVIHYTLDGTAPTPTAAAYSGPVTVPLPGDGREVVVTARAFLQDGRTSAERSARIRRTSLRVAAAVPRTSLAPGLRLDYVEGSFQEVAELGSAAVVRGDTVRSVALPAWAREERFGLLFTGWVDAPADGIYTFHLTSDDGAVLRVAGEVVVDHDGPHGPTEASGQVALRGGLHPVELRYFQAGGGRTLELAVTPPADGRISIPAAWWWHAP